jgi:Rod binding domain-containing protein
MAIDTSTSISSAQAGSLNAQADQLLSRSRAALASPAPLSKVDAKIEKAGKDFESILVGSWLQQAEQSFAKVPGGDGMDDDDSSKDQFQGIAMQALAGSLTASGGIGIAKMITQHLRSAAEGSQKVAPSAVETSEKSSL